MQDLQHSFAARGIERGGTLYLKASDALDFIEAARHAKMPVLGVDAFIITEQATEPMLEHILDCSVGVFRQTLGLQLDVLWRPAATRDSCSRLLCEIQAAEKAPEVVCRHAPPNKALQLTAR